MVLLQRLQDFARGARRVDEPRRGRERRLVATQVVFGDPQQCVERRIDHFVRHELAPVQVGANREVAVRAREQVRLQPGLVGPECRDHGVVGLLELGLQSAILDGRECVDHGLAEELLVAVELLDRDFRVDAGHVRKVAPRRGEHLGHRAFARHEAPQAHGSGRVVALDEGVGRVGDAAAVHVWITGPAPDAVQVEPARFQPVQQELAIEPVLRRQRSRIDAHERVAEPGDRGKFLPERRAGIVLQLPVELVQAEIGGVGRVAAIEIGQDFSCQRGIRGIARDGPRHRRGGGCDGGPREGESRQDQRWNSGHVTSSLVPPSDVRPDVLNDARSDVPRASSCPPPLPCG